MTLPRLLHPVPGCPISQYFGENPEWYAKWGYPGHNGLDFSCVVGTPVRAPASGWVRIFDSGDEGYGLHLYITFVGEDYAYQHVLAHLSKVLVDVCDFVEAGQVVALTGNTGYSTGPHLHWGEKDVNNQIIPYRGWVDPAPHIKMEHAMNIRKMGVQYQTPPETGAESTDIVTNSNIPIVKWIDAHHLGYNPFPNQRVINRSYMPEDEERSYWMRGTTGAVEYYAHMEKTYAKLRDMGIRDTTCVYNPQPKNNREQQQLDQFMYKWVTLCEKGDMIPWVYSLLTYGVKAAPELSDTFANAVALATNIGGGIEFIEKGAPSLSDGFGYFDLYLISLVDERNISPRVFIGDVCIDGAVLGDEANGKRGWKDWGSWVYTTPDTFDLGEQCVMDKELWWRNMLGAARLYEVYEEIVGYTFFTTTPNEQHASFDVDGELVQRIADLYAPHQVTDDEIRARSHEIVVPLVIDSALDKAGRARGYVAVSNEDRETGEVIKVFRAPGVDDEYYIGVWEGGDRVRWITERN